MGNKTGKGKNDYLFQPQNLQKQQSQETKYVLQSLPELPEVLSYSQCVFYPREDNNSELIICGGWDNLSCYSYHIQKQQYKFICSYPSDVTLGGHTIICYNSNKSNSSSSSSIFSFNRNSGNNSNNNNNNNNNNFILLSFGGHQSNHPAYHTLKMKYESVWNVNNNNNNNNNDNDNGNGSGGGVNNGGDGNDQIDIIKKQGSLTVATATIATATSATNDIAQKQYSGSFLSFTSNSNNNKNKNQWYPLPNNIKLGQKKSHNLCGARGIIDGSKKHLLFITREPKNIDVVNIKSFQYIENTKNSSLPISNTNYVSYHCFVKTTSSINNRKRDTKNNKYNCNKFFLMSRGETLLIEYDERNKEFFYQILSTFQPCYQYAFACWNNSVFIFGGDNIKERKKMDHIWKFQMKEQSTSSRNFNWKECEFKMPDSIGGAVAVMSGSDSSIHIIGGTNDDGEYQSTHYVMCVLTAHYIAIIMSYWTRDQKLTRLGWISEFDNMIAKYMHVVG